MSPHFQQGNRYGSSRAFTLIELLIVIGIMGLLFALSGPLVNALKGSGDLAKSAGDIQSILEQARSYAMANNTYVYAGLQEVDVIRAQANPPAYVPGVGRVAVALVASTTGMRPYMNTPAALPSGSITPLGKLCYFDNLCITNSASLSATGGMNRPAADVDLSAVTAVTTFQWPLTGIAQYTFSKVVEFSPQGTAAVQTSAASIAPLAQCIEIPLLPTRGNVASTNANQAAIQINGITGAVNLFRPGL